MTDASGKFKFDADTAAYDAKIEHSANKTHGIGEAFAHAVPEVHHLTSAVGAIGLAVEEVHRAWEKWLERLKEANKISAQLTERLAGSAGAAGLINQFPALRKSIETAHGPLTAEQRVGAFENFAGDFPGLTEEQGGLAVRQAQQASLTLGAGGVPSFMKALGGGMEVGLSQEAAGDLAMLVSQSGARGLEAFDKAVAKFVDRFPDRSGDFNEFLKSADSEVFGTRGALRGGQQIQRGLGSVGGLLDRSANAAGSVDEELGRDQRVRAAVSGADIANAGLVGDRAKLIQQLDEINKSGEQLGGGLFGFAIQKQVAKKSNAGDTNALLNPFAYTDGFVTRHAGSIEHLTDVVELRLQALLDAQATAGAAKFRTEAHEELEK